MKVSLKSEISTFVAKVALDFIHSHVSLRSEIEKVSKEGAGQKFYHFPLETYLLIAKYQKLGQSVQGN